MNHPRRLAQEQLVSAADGTSMVGGKQAEGGKSKQPSKRTELLFQRLKDSNKRYRPVNQKVVSESKHTLTLANGSVLRKSGVAGKVIKPNAPKISDKLTIPPPTMSALKQRAELKRAQEGQTAGQVHEAQPKLERTKGHRIVTMGRRLIQIRNTSHKGFQNTPDKIAIQQQSNMTGEIIRRHQRHLPK